MLEMLKKRFLENMQRHAALEWPSVEQRLRTDPRALEVLRRMEDSGGEPDTIGFEEETGALLFCDCSKETPAGRRSLCYDEAALQARLRNPPAGSAQGQAAAIGAELMTEAMYRRLQQLGAFDLKTSSWILTPETIRQQGGALFCERRYGRIFTFHNGADSYYSVRGWRGFIRV